MKKTRCFSAASALATLLFAGPGCGDECADMQPIPETMLRFPGKIYPLNNWVWDDGSTAISGSVGTEWPLDSPSYGHPAVLHSGRYDYDFQTNFDDYLDLATGTYHQAFWTNGKPPENHAFLPPDQGGKIDEYLEKIHGHLTNNFPFLDRQKPRCAACANHAYLSRYLTDQANRFSFTDEYLIPPDRLYFGGSLHYSPIFYQEGGCGYSSCTDFSIRVGAAINLDETYPEATTHYGLKASSWLYVRELDLETGNLQVYYTQYTPTDPLYLNMIKEVKDTVCELYDGPIDNCETWMFSKVAVMKEACEYLGYIIDRKAAPGP